MPLGMRMVTRSPGRIGQNLVGLFAVVGELASVIASYDGARLLTRHQVR
jgi:hypothetical protein